MTQFRSLTARLPLTASIGLAAVSAELAATALRSFGPATSPWLAAVFDGCAVAIIVVPLCRHWLSGIERRHAETAGRLREGEARFRELFDDAPVGYHELDAAGRIVRVNRTELLLLGFSEEEMIGRPVSEFVVQSNVSAEQVRAKLAGEVPVGEPFEREFRRRDGTTLAVTLTDRLIHDGQGRIIGLRSSLQDNTARRRQELRLEALTREAVAATQAKSEFLANMSHEIRTPLNAVIGMSGLLIETGLRGEQREFAETIRASGDALLGLINDILDYSKIESGHLELEQSPFDLRTCIESSLDVLAARAAEKKLDLLYWIDVDAPVAVSGDITRLRQVLVNLVGNAVKFTARGEVFVNVSVVRYLPDGSVQLAFAVRDSGIGIPADRMDRLFKTFSQVDASTTKHFGGTGLGLAICRRLVELMGGRIWAESVFGSGTTFAFEVTMQPVAAEPRAFQDSPPAEISGRRVLVVDDNAVNRRILCLQVGSWGLLPRAVGSAREAVALIDSGEPFDVALLDLRMPEMDGIQLAGEIRRRRSAAELPIVLLSSFGQATAPAGLGLAASLVKPVKPQVLFDRLVEIFHGRKARRVVAPEPAAAESLAQEHPLTILIAEDNPVNLRVARLMLQRLGYQAEGVGNGCEVLAAVERRSYDLILMDMQMPEMDGLQATRELCLRWAPAGRPRIVAMTANAALSDREECLAAGMDGFVAKPVRLQDLRAALLATPARGVLVG